MMRSGMAGLRALVLLGAALLAACGDGTSPSLQGAEVRIFLGGSEYDEQTIAVGQTLLLDADVYDATGKIVEGHSFQWSSDDPAVAGVTQAGVVTGVAIGTTRVTVRHDVGEATAIVNVAAPVTGSPTCTVGEAQTFTVGVPREFRGARRPPCAFLPTRSTRWSW